MTFNELKNRIADRLNLTAATALTRIGQEINERYREIVSSVGLVTSIRTTKAATTTIANRSLTFQCEKILSVYDTAYTPVRVLQEYSFDELRNMTVGTDPPRAYAIERMGASTVTIFLSTSPATAFTLTADVEDNPAELEGNLVPAFPASYNDILIRGVMADELYKMEKYDLSQQQEDKFEKRLSELRFFIAKSAYGNLYQGKHPDSRPSAGLV